MGAVLLSLVAFPKTGWSQIPPGLPIPLPPITPGPPPKPLPPPLVPPILPPVPPAPKREPSPPMQVFIREIRLEGNTVFTSEQLAEVTAPYTNRQLSAEDLESLRLALTVYYVNRGYITSGAVIPSQTVENQVLLIRIVEGTLSRVDVEGARWFRPSWFQDRIALSAGPPVNVNALQERLQLFQQDPRVASVNAELRPGLTRGDSTLNLKVADRQPWRGTLEFNNYQSPTVGAEQGFVTLENQNVFGIGDTFSAQYGRSLGVDPIVNVRYAVPVTARDTTLSAYYRKFDFVVKDDAFRALDIRNKAQIIGLALRQPVYRTAKDEVAVGLTGEHEINKTTSLGQPFPFVAGAPGGVFRVSALRLSQEWTHRTSEQVLALFSRFSMGVGALGATTSDATPQSADGRFFSWLGEAQWIRQLPWHRVQALAKTTLQFSNDHLFPLEQMVVGGRNSVRGYREYTFVRDNAFIGNLEFRVPVYTNATGMDVLHLAPFVDIGRAWNAGASNGSDRDTLASVGAGLLWQIHQTSRFEVYWGQQLNHLRDSKRNLQDHGLHVQFVVQPF
jgi:hemolysin activation/secretion protein